MWPTSVAMPVAVTMNRPVPRVTFVFMYTMSVRSPSAASLFLEPVGALADRNALAGQRGLRDLQRRRLEQAAVGGHEIARLDRDHVAGDQRSAGS